MFEIERNSRKFGDKFNPDNVLQMRSRNEEFVESAMFKNTLLKSLDKQTILRLGLNPVKFELNHEMEYPHRPIKHLYFLESGMASMTATFQDGSQVEVSTFGFESVIGVSALMGAKKSLNRVYIQIAGHGYSCPIEAARKEFRLGGDFQYLALRYVQAQLDQATQYVGCNAKHHFEPRLARWLLVCADRSHSDIFKMSHELLADMLGGTRATVSLAAASLKRKGLIQYSRGVIRILDSAGLERNACECYQVIKFHLKNYAEFETTLVE
jgi:CRP-like cAMP-binding protein